MDASVVGLGPGGRTGKQDVVDNLDYEVMYSKVRRLIDLIDDSFRNACCCRDFFHQKFGRIIIDGPDKKFFKRKLARMNNINVCYLDCAEADEFQVFDFFSNIQDGSMLILDDYSSLFRQLTQNDLLIDIQKRLERAMFRKNILVLFIVYPSSAKFFSWSDDAYETIVYDGIFDESGAMRLSNNGQPSFSLGRDFQISIDFSDRH